MQKLDQKKRPPVYNDRLSVLDFRPKKRRLNKPHTPSPLAVQTLTPTSTLSETVGSATASPRDDDALLGWDAAEFTEELVEKCATLLLDAVMEALPVGEVSSDADDEDGDGDEGSVSEDAASVGTGAWGKEGDGSEILPQIVIDDDETEDEWRPNAKLQQKKNSNAEKKPRARRKPTTNERTRRGSTGSVKSLRSARKSTAKGKENYVDESSQADDTAGATPRPERRASRSQVGAS
ncbi:hypothetical protein EJ08DRAFT_666363 [Tothia fuscella]|uniref:Uncharacterized protein n=1 Tax=Tothia fuscella TaxID=1048955 RepID=A0A9P4NEP4_9PEZI|nr:hypothetical protein EJ08DRAFT_666363 [Tothia fuscella]